MSINTENPNDGGFRLGFEPTATITKCDLTPRKCRDLVITQLRASVYMRECVN